MAELEDKSKEENSSFNNKISRRDFLKFLGAGAISMGMANIIGIDKLLQSSFATPENYKNNDLYNSDNSTTINPQYSRSVKAFNIRVDAAKFEKNFNIPQIYNNGDETLYKNKIASFSKTLPHNNLGEVDLDAYSKLTYALDTKDYYDFENIPMGGSSPFSTLQHLKITKTDMSDKISSFESKSDPPNNTNDYLKLVNPMAAFSFELIGPDSHNLFLKPAPNFDSTEEAGEIAELYWQALAREVAFTDYENNSIINNASNDLSQFSRFYGPKQSGRVTPETLFRGNTDGDLKGPYISQFLLKPIPYGAHTIEQKYNVSLPGSDFMFSYSSWLSCQNGIVTEIEKLDGTSRYIRNGRDLADYVHKDFPSQPYVNACLILLGARSTFDSGNVYTLSLTQIGFSTFGAPHALYFAASIANLGLKAAWFQKWLVHRRLRPETFGGRIHNNKSGKTEYPINKEILDSQVLDMVFKKNSTYLLPTSYPEGAPPHPAYPSGHATNAGASVTLLKAFFDEDAIIENPVVPTLDGQSLVPYTGHAELTVGGELNKLASNIAMGRNFAGIHWRSDAIEGMKLGEELAIRYLAEHRDIFFERSSFTLTKFDGTRIKINTYS
ncbi:MAG: phosphatase PAP2 family protein [Nitrososphaeraceae archaeon]